MDDKEIAAAIFGAELALAGTIVGIIFTAVVNGLAEWIKVKPLRRDRERFDGVKRVRQLVHELKELHYAAEGEKSEDAWGAVAKKLDEVRTSWNIYCPVMDRLTRDAVDPLIRLSAKLAEETGFKKQIELLSRSTDAKALIRDSRKRLDVVYGNLCGTIVPDAQKRKDLGS